MRVHIKKISDRAQMPHLGSEKAGAYDVCYSGEESVLIRPDGVKKLETGLSFALPDHMAMLILPRSGLATNSRLRPANTPGLLDADYRGELFIALENFGLLGQTIEPGQRIAQIMFVPRYSPEFIVSATLPETIRGNGGFGSTGV